MPFHKSFLFLAYNETTKEYGKRIFLFLDETMSFVLNTAFYVVGGKIQVFPIRFLHNVERLNKNAVEIHEGHSLLQ
jgi:hypothetical protein